MARIRSVKPDFFTDDKINELNPATRLFFIGLWTQADRYGRLLDRPKHLRIKLLPCDRLDGGKMIQSLETEGLIIRYKIEAEKYIQIVNFELHQRPHHTETGSNIPDINGVVPVKQPLKKDRLNR